jgi:hypothetical protein
MNQPVDRTAQGGQSGPTAGPIASSMPSASPLADRQSGPEVLANHGALRGTITSTPRRQRRHITTSVVNDIADRISARDRAVLLSIEQHQFLATRHIEALHFTDIAPSARSRITRRNLARLRELRVIAALDRKLGGARAGSEGLTYFVDVVGDRILHERLGQRARQTHEPSARFLKHRLAIADVHITLIQADRDRQFELVESAVEPTAWRAFTGIGAARRVLKPDVYAETATDDDFVHAWFIEVDLGTESIPTLLAKCREYEAYRQAGIEQDRHGAFPLVVWSITHRDPAKAERRRHALTDAIAIDRNLPNALFRIVRPEGLLPLIQTGGEQ